jgi:hypothetical protein
MRQKRVIYSIGADVEHSKPALPRSSAYGRNMAAPPIFPIIDRLPAEPLTRDEQVRPLADRHLAAGLRHFVASSDVMRLAGAYGGRSASPCPPAGAYLELALLARRWRRWRSRRRRAARRWTVNGHALPAPPIGAPFAWVPPGFVRLSVTDHFQRTDTAEIRVE